MAAADCVTVITKGLVSEAPATSTKTTTDKQEKNEKKVLITPTLSSPSEDESAVFSNNNEAEASTSGLLYTPRSCLYKRILTKFIDFLISAFLDAHKYFM